MNQQEIENKTGVDTNVSLGVADEEVAVVSVLVQQRVAVRARDRAVVPRATPHAAPARTPRDPHTTVTINHHTYAGKYIALTRKRTTPLGFNDAPFGPPKFQLIIIALN